MSSQGIYYLEQVNSYGLPMTTNFLIGLSRELLCERVNHNASISQDKMFGSNRSGNILTKLALYRRASAMVNYVVLHTGD